MRTSRFALATVFALSAALLVPAAAMATKTDVKCPADSSGWNEVDLDGWWVLTVAGFGEAGIPVYEQDGVTFTQEFEDFAVSAGFASAQDLHDFIFGAQWDGLDANGNDLVCAKIEKGGSPGQPSYFINAHDDRTATKN